MRYAIVSVVAGTYFGQEWPAGKVVNVCEWDGTTRYEPPTGTKLVLAGEVGPGVTGPTLDIGDNA